MLALIRFESMTAIKKRVRSGEELCAEAEDIEAYASGTDHEAVIAARDVIRRAVPLLSAAYGEVVKRVYLRGQGVALIAAELGTSEEDIRQRLSRALKKLRDIIDGLERDDAEACAAALSLLALLALFEGNQRPGASEETPLRPDTWGPAAATPRHAAPRPRSSGGARPSSVSASLGIMAAAAAFMLLGDVPLAPALVVMPTGAETASIVAEETVSEANALVLTIPPPSPGASEGAAPQSRRAAEATPAADASASSRADGRSPPGYDPFLESAMYSPPHRDARSTGGRSPNQR
jgi:Sigma-70, region 4